MEQDNFNDICNNFEFSKEVQFIRRLIEDLKILFSSNVNIGIFEKGEKDLVTSMDLAVEKKIISELNSNFPNDIILSEETASTTKINNRCWVIDPIDGTCNYANDLPLYGVQLAFTRDKTIIISCIYFPKSNECFIALKGQGAFLNGDKIHVKKEEDISKMVVSLGDFNPRDEETSKLEYYTLGKLRKKVMRIRMFGASCADFCYLATGRISAHLRYYSFPWDIVPGILIAEEAGAIFSHIDGSKLDVESSYGMVVSNSSKFNDYISSLTN